MPAPAGYKEVAAPASAKPPAGYSEVPPPPPGMQAAAPAPAAPGIGTRFLQGVGLPSSWDELSQQWHDFADAPDKDVGDAAGRMVKGYATNLASQAKKSYGEVVDAGHNIQDHTGTLLGNWGKAGAAGSDLLLRGVLAPIGGETVANIAEDTSEGNYKGATGGGLALLAQALLMRGKGSPKPADAVNKLGYAAGGEVPALRATLPEIQQTVGAKGVKTIGDLADAVQQTSTRLDQKFNAGLARMKGQFMPTEIADALESRAQIQPPSADGQAIATELRSMANDYRKPWTDAQLNQERMLRNGMAKGFYNKAGSGQMAAMRSSAQTIADQTIADAAKDVLYGRMERAMPGSGYQALKLQQGHLIDIMDQLDGQVSRLETQQAKFKGAPMLEKPGLTVSGSPHGITPRVHLGSYIESLLGKGPMDKANAAVAKALPDTAAATKARRAAVLALPLSQLAAPAIPPPPSAADAADAAAPSQ